MKMLNIRRAVLTVGTIAMLALSTGAVPNAPTTGATAQAAELAQGSGNGNGGGGGNSFNGGGGNRNGGGHHNGGGNHNGNHNGGGHHGGHVSSSFQYYHGPHHSYGHDWYYARHISFPHFYQVYYYEPVDVCFAEYYFFEGAFYCYNG